VTRTTSAIATTSIADAPCADAEAIAILESLVRTPSLSGHESDAAAVFLAHAQSFGFDAYIDEVGNVIAHRGDASPAAREIILLGHIDTVPGHIPVRIENNTLWGRGSVDAKGPLVAFLIAASRAHIPDGIRLVVAAAVGEETPHSPGARHLAATRAPAACIIGEPSGADGFTLGYKGRLLIHAECIRACAHTAGPDGSAADALLAWWHAEDALLSRELWGGQFAGSSLPTKTFDTLQRTVRSLSTFSDGLADTARMTIGLRLPPGGGGDPRDLERAIRDRAPQSIALDFEGHEAAVLADRNNAVALALASAIRIEGHTPRPKVKTGTSDMNVVAPIWNCPIAAYGPGDSALDHTPDERLDLAEYAASIRILTRAIETLAAPV
jgi:LysW-gamma-L-lysine carboxypeptidase